MQAHGPNPNKIYPNENIKEDTDFRRVGLFAGYELAINKSTPFKKGILGEIE